MPVSEMKTIYIYWTHLWSKIFQRCLISVLFRQERCSRVRRLRCDNLPSNNFEQRQINGTVGAFRECLVEGFLQLQIVVLQIVPQLFRKNIELVVQISLVLPEPLQLLLLWQGIFGD